MVCWACVALRCARRWCVKGCAGVCIRDCVEVRLRGGLRLGGVKGCAGVYQRLR
jgi:hypothetical protein